MESTPVDPDPNEFLVSIVPPLMPGDDHDDSILMMWFDALYVTNLPDDLSTYGEDVTFEFRKKTVSYNEMSEALKSLPQNVLEYLNNQVGALPKDEFARWRSERITRAWQRKLWIHPTFGCEKKLGAVVRIFSYITDGIGATTGWTKRPFGGTHVWFDGDQMVLPSHPHIQRMAFGSFTLWMRGIIDGEKPRKVSLRSA
jgi:hypothetical protein